MGLAGYLQGEGSPRRLALHVRVVVLRPSGGKISACDHGSQKLLIQIYICMTNFAGLPVPSIDNLGTHFTKTHFSTHQLCKMIERACLEL